MVPKKKEKRKKEFIQTTELDIYCYGPESKSSFCASCSHSIARLQATIFIVPFERCSISGKIAIIFEKKKKEKKGKGLRKPFPFFCVKVSVFKTRAGSPIGMQKRNEICAERECE
eukprot:TRINITY_DN10736_c0_g2_i1.p1 TRINITY_DN10736_c0_g2~~TRINITY_DN10736_c0_g2_i1.p1  ORF type:complete len:115 (-),score=17.01 TRINITY_DN10736_c0_g2_i1:335-679(-)